jgi:hypothetical protein
MFIPDPGSGSRFFSPSRIPYPGVKKAPDPGSQIRNTAYTHGELLKKATLVAVERMASPPSFLQYNIGNVFTCYTERRKTKREERLAAISVSLSLLTE